MKITIIMLLDLLDTYLPWLYWSKEAQSKICMRCIKPFLSICPSIYRGCTVTSPPILYSSIEENKIDLFAPIWKGKFIGGFNLMWLAVDCSAFKKVLNCCFAEYQKPFNNRKSYMNNNNFWTHLITCCVLNKRNQKWSKARVLHNFTPDLQKLTLIYLQYLWHYATLHSATSSINTLHNAQCVNWRERFACRKQNGRLFLEFWLWLHWSREEKEETISIWSALYFLFKMYNSS